MMLQSKPLQRLYGPLFRKLLAATVAFLFVCFSTFAQERTVTGSVTDIDGNSLIGVNVVVKGTTTGKVTDLNGEYSITVPDDDAVLVFSYVGYLTEEIPVGENQTIHVTLSEDITTLDEVVVIGYGVQKKKLVTGATVQVDNEALTKNNVTRVESALQGITPGMTIVKQSGQPGSDYNITIRGIASPNENNPLVLIDGVPGDLNTLSPSDIESIDVLKDAASAAIYGSRAGSGVILVTTKKGQSGKMMVNYDAYYGVSTLINNVEPLNATQYTNIMNEASLNTDNDPQFTEEEIAQLGEGTNWIDEATNTNFLSMGAPKQNHHLGISGGNEVSTYSMSFAYAKEEGIFNFENKSQFERLNIRLNSQHQLNNILKVGENLTYTRRERNELGATTIYNNFMRDLLQASPLIEPYDPNVYDGFGRSDFHDEQINPIASMHYNYNGVNQYDDIIGNVYAELEIIDGLKLRSDLGGTLQFSTYKNFTDSFTLTPFTYQVTPHFDQDMSRDFYYNFDNYLSYETNIGSHNVLAMVGMNVQDNQHFHVNGNADGFRAIQNLPPVLSNAATLDTALVEGDYGPRDSRYSYFGRLSYNYQEKYLATLSYRQDVSSRFGPENRIGRFPAASVGWTISEEPFLSGSPWLDFLKFRGSWGQNGKEPYIAFRYLATVSNDNRNYIIGNNTQLGVSPNILASPTLKWEASEQINFGFDSRFFDNFRVIFDWYKKTSKDWILPTPVQGLTGIEAINTNQDPFTNAGEVVNSGVELELGYNQHFGDFRLNVKGNIAYNQNEVTAISQESDIIHGSASVLYNGSPEFYRVEVGYPMGYFWGYETDGLFQTDEEAQNYTGGGDTPLQPGAVAGDVRRIDHNGDTVINDEDKVMLGNPHPDYVYGLSINTAYKNWDFSMNISGQLGHQIVKAYRAEERFFNNYTTEILDRWQGEGTSNTIPRVTRGTEPNQNWRRFSDLYVHDADFMRLKSINLGYNFKSLLFANVPVQQFRLYFSATNLLTLTKYNGLDPEVGFGSYSDDEGNIQDGYASGIDLGFYPVARTYLIGVNVKF